MVTDPAYRATHTSMTDTRTKEEVKEQKRWDQKVKRAYGQRARGARGKGITETIQAFETGLAAQQAQGEESSGFITKATDGLSKNGAENIGAKASEAQSSVKQADQGIARALNQIATDTKEIRNTIKDAITFS